MLKKCLSFQTKKKSFAQLSRTKFTKLSNFICIAEIKPSPIFFYFANIKHCTSPWFMNGKKLAGIVSKLFSEIYVIHLCSGSRLKITVCENWTSCQKLRKVPIHKNYPAHTVTLATSHPISMKNHRNSWNYFPPIDSDFIRLSWKSPYNYVIMYTTVISSKVKKEHKCYLHRWWSFIIAPYKIFRSRNDRVFRIDLKREEK